MLRGLGEFIFRQAVIHSWSFLLERRFMKCILIWVAASSKYAVAKNGFLENSFNSCLG